jgi:hypothetical protein
MALGRMRTLSERIKISRTDMKLFLAGRKKCTIRIGIVKVSSEMLMLTDGRRTVPIRVTNVDDSRRFGDLNDRDAHDEGFQSVAELIADLRQYYPRAAPGDAVSIIYFEQVESELRLF